MHHATGNAQYNLFSPHYKTPDNLFVKVPYAQYTQFVLSLQKNTTHKPHSFLQN